MEIIEPDEDARREWRAWMAERPSAVRAVAERFNPWTLYRLRQTGQIVAVSSYFEDGTISVDVFAEFNPLAMWDTNVFGIDPDDLEPCSAEYLAARRKH